MGKIHIKYFAFLLSTLMVLFVLLEIISYGGLYALSEFKRVHYVPIYSKEMNEQHSKITAKIIKNEFMYTQVDSFTGWSIAPNKTYRGYRSNSQGLRGNEDYSTVPPSDRIRIATFGDSFTHGDQVENHETWQYYMERANPEFQVLNFGVPGYGTDQAFLRYQSMGKKFNADVVLIGLMSENIERHVNVYRPFYDSGTSLPLAKPRFTVVDEKLTLIPNPLKTPGDYKALLDKPHAMFKLLGAQDYHYHSGYHEGPFDFLALVRLAKMIGNKVFEINDITDLNGVYNVKSEAVDITIKIFETFYKQVLDDGKIPIIVILPHEEDVIRLKADKAVRYQPLLEKLDAQNLRYIDALGAFKNDSILQNYQSYFKGHYSPSGNKLISQFLTKEIKTILKEHPINRVVTRKGSRNSESQKSHE